MTIFHIVKRQALAMVLMTFFHIFEWLYITLYIKIFFPLGPHDSIIAYDGFYYANKVPYLEGNIEIFNFDFSNPSLSDYFCRMV